MQDTINKLNSLYTSYLCKEISCNVCSEIESYQKKLRPEIDELKSYLENSGYAVTLHSASSFFAGGPSTTIAKIASLDNKLSHEEIRELLKRDIETVDSLAKKIFFTAIIAAAVFAIWFLAYFI